MSKVVDTEYYDALGVSVDASEDEIKSKYKKMAIKWHPDRWVNGTKEDKEIANAKFLEMKQAYDILSDPEKRQTYDQFGKESVADGNQGVQMTEEMMREMFAGMGGFPFPGMSGMGGMGGMGGGRSKKKEELKMPDLKHTVNVNLKQVYLGEKIEFQVERYCLKKDANPSIDSFKCPTCKGEGIVMKVRQVGPGMMQQSQEHCSKCKGNKIIISDEFFTKEIKKFTRSIHKGVLNGSKIIIDNQGHDIPPCFKKGNDEKTDIVLIINCNQLYQTSDEKFTYIRPDRTPYDLQVKFDIELHEMLCGTVKEITFVNNEKICIRIPPLYAEKDHVVIIPKMGMPFYKEKGVYGSLMIALNVVKREISDEHKNVIWKLLTNKSMEESTNEVLKPFDNKFINSMTVEEFKTSDEMKNSEDNMRKFHEKMEEEEGHGHGGHGGHGHGQPANCPMQ